MILVSTCSLLTWSQVISQNPTSFYFMLPEYCHNKSTPHFAFPHIFNTNSPLNNCFI